MFSVLFFLKAESVSALAALSLAAQAKAAALHAEKEAQAAHVETLRSEVQTLRAGKERDEEAGAVELQKQEHETQLQVQRLQAEVTRLAEENVLELQAQKEAHEAESAAELRAQRVVQETEVEVLQSTVEQTRVEMAQKVAELHARDAEVEAQRLGVVDEHVAELQEVKEAQGVQVKTLQSEIVDLRRASLSIETEVARLRAANLALQLHAAATNQSQSPLQSETENGRAEEVLLSSPALVPASFDVVPSPNSEELGRMAATASATRLSLAQVQSLAPLAEDREEVTAEESTALGSAAVSLPQEQPASLSPGGEVTTPSRSRRPSRQETKVIFGCISYYYDWIIHLLCCYYYY